MSVNKLTVRNYSLLYFSVAAICLFVIMANVDYYEDAVNSIPTADMYPYLSTIVGGDSITYFKHTADIYSIILIGFREGTVSLGSIFSLIGINFIMEMLDLIPLPLYISWLFFAVMIIYLSATYGDNRNLNNIQIFSLCLYPLMMVYLLAPNKEIFAVVLLLLVPKIHNIVALFFIGILFGVVREIYFVIIFFYAISRFAKSNLQFFLLVYIATIAVVVVLPTSYFTEKYITEEQQSAFITEAALTLIETKWAAAVGVIIKILLGIVGPIVSGYKNIVNMNIIGILYLVSGLIFIRLIVKIALKRGSSIFFIANKGCKIVEMNISRLMIFYMVFMSLAPGNPARFIMPALIILLALTKMKDAPHENNNIRL